MEERIKPPYAPAPPRSSSMANAVPQLGASYFTMADHSLHAEASAAFSPVQLVPAGDGPALTAARPRLAALKSARRARGRRAHGPVWASRCRWRGPSWSSSRAARTGRCAAWTSACAKAMRPGRVMTRRRCRSVGRCVCWKGAGQRTALDLFIRNRRAG